jgi:hypothetical protein
MVVEAALPETSIDPSPAARQKASRLPSANHGEKVTVIPDVEQEMCVIRHEAIRITSSLILAADMAQFLDAGAA